MRGGYRLQVPDTRYVPRSYTLDYHDFGKKESVRWLDEADLDDLELDRLGGAKLQHVMAVDMNQRIARRFLSLRHYAEHTGQKYERLARMLRGEIVMRLDDVANANRHLDLELLS
jgi:hypothetical protein